MIILFLAMACGVVALLAFIFTCGGHEPQKKQPPKLRIEPTSAQSKPVSLSEGSETEKLSAKFKKLKEDYQRLEEELASLKVSYAQAQDELQKVKSWVEKDQTGQENMRKELRELKDRLIKKGQEYEQEFSLNVGLKKESGEYKQKYEIVENSNREHLERRRVLEAQNNAYKEEFKSQNQLIAELKKKSDENEWVSKKEYEELKVKLTQSQNNAKDKV